MDTIVQECNKCGLETDCIEEICLECRLKNENIEKLKNEILDKVDDRPVLLDNSILLDWADRLNSLIV